MEIVPRGTTFGQAYLTPSLLSSIFREHDLLRYVACLTLTAPYIYPNDRMLLLTRRYEGLHSIAILLGVDRFPFMASPQTMQQFERERKVRFLSLHQTTWVVNQLRGILENWKADGCPEIWECRYPAPVRHSPEPPWEEVYARVAPAVGWDAMFDQWVTLPESVNKEESEGGTEEASEEVVEKFARFLVESFAPKPEQVFLTTRREEYGNR